MRRKNAILAAICMSIVAISSPVSASDTTNIDLEAMSIDELMDLKSEVDQKIADKGGDNTIGQGVYYVGTDIKASNFKLTPVVNMTDYDVTIKVYNDEESYKNDPNGGNPNNYIKLYRPDEGEKAQSANLNLKDGQVIWIISGEAIIEEVHSSWMPEEKE